jgi:hypothetical protein
MKLPATIGYEATCNGGPTSFREWIDLNGGKMEYSANLVCAMRKKNGEVVAIYRFVGFHSNKTIEVRGIKPNYDSSLSYESMAVFFDYCSAIDE